MDYVNNIESTILETVNQYESDEAINEALLWEMTKLQIRDTSIKYSKAKTKKMKNKKNIAALERQLENCTNKDKEALAELLRVKKRELESVIGYKTKGAIIRSKARWYNEGEKITNISFYFNRHCKKKTIMQIKAKDEANLTNDSDILRVLLFL